MTKSLQEVKDQRDVAMVQELRKLAEFYLHADNAPAFCKNSNPVRPRMEYFDEIHNTIIKLAERK